MRAPSKGDIVPVRIINRSRGLLTFALNSGESVYLAPSERSQSLPTLEVMDNRWVDRLRERGLIVVEQEEEPQQARGRRRPAS